MEFCGSPGMPVDIWRSGRVQTVVGFGHKRVRVGVGKVEQESLSLGWNGRSELRGKQLKSRLAPLNVKEGVKINNSSGNNNNKMIIVEADSPMASY